ncbi:aminotransferase-like domain-containing protein [Enterococcus sp. LJL90]
MEWRLQKSTGPIYLQIMDLIIESIQKGELEAGEKIPTERELAKLFAVNRTTVVHALDELASLGWLIRKQGSGTRVNEGNWGRQALPRTNWQGILQQTAYNRQHPFLLNLKKRLADSEVLDLFTGELPHQLIPNFQLPSFRWEDFLAEETQLSAAGYLPLQKAIQEELQKDHQLEVSLEDILITSGAQQGLFLLLQVLLAPGDSVAIENPSFLYGLPIFQAAGISLFGVGLDREGIKLNELKQLIVTKKIKMLILNPTYQNPTGIVMSLKRRQEVLELCGRYQIPVVEDNVFGEINFTKKIPLLKSLAPQQVIYLGSLSKILGASTKIGWLLAPHSLMAPLIEARQVMDSTVSIFPQVLATAALSDQTFLNQRQLLVDALAKRAATFLKLVAPFEKDWRISEIKGGFYVWLTWQRGDIAKKNWQLFLDKGLLIAPSFLFSNEKNALRINFSRLEEKDYRKFFLIFSEITDTLKKS